ncbi:hypothetical protein HPP92_002510 [Vanilla planifolia]|uniref:Uncharacterized protein n=1 Tax=Vanilla planifolia TaxID=51239 RepID=A0A835RU57_VANPL|nr:hypothetical protein HPP92_002875 [Vanilla planifolia]KAG0502438.1 hypothetical protein HPP92_002510 [Vanilla planifolia]
MESCGEESRNVGGTKKRSWYRKNSGRCLDLTSFQLHDLGEVEIPEDLVELISGLIGSQVDPRIGLLCILRSFPSANLFDDEGIEPLCGWTAISGCKYVVLFDSSAKFKGKIVSKIGEYGFCKTVNYMMLSDGERHRNPNKFTGTVVGKESD